MGSQKPIHYVQRGFLIGKRSINQKNNIIKHCRVELEGRKSDIRIFQETPLKIHRKIKVKGDLGYVGIAKTHARSQVPYKKPKNGELTKK